MPNTLRGAGGLGLAALLIVLSQAAPLAQSHAGQVSLAVMSPASDADARERVTLVDDMIRRSDLVLRAAFDDPALPDRRHEGFRQYHEGLRVVGADVSVQTDRGVTVSVFGNIYTGIDLELTPTLSIDDATTALETVSGSTVFGGRPELTILPTVFDTYALAYTATMRNATSVFIDAHTGQLLRTIDERLNDSAVGSGQGALGDTQKVSADAAAGTFRAHDRLRPAELLTLDTRGSSAALTRLEDGTAFDSDFATDTDNIWTDGGVVDTHVNAGFTYDYFFARHGWAGMDDQNSRVFLAVNDVNVLPNNAFFLRPPFGPGGGGLLAFGETTNTQAPITALDTVGHEFMHGVTFFAVNRRTGNPSGLVSAPLVDSVGPAEIPIGDDLVPCASVTFGGDPLYCPDGSLLLFSNTGGAINEAFADALGTGTEFFIQPAGTGPLRADYDIGEDVPDLGALGGQPGPIRSMDTPAQIVIDPPTGVRYPDHFSRRLRYGAVILEGTQEDPVRLALIPVIFLDGRILVLGGTDGGGVHLNATILGHAFYLAIEGGTNATSGRSVTGVGVANREQIERVFFRAMTALMPSIASFQTAAAVLCQAAVDLYGVNSSVSNAIDQALLAVGL